MLRPLTVSVECADYALPSQKFPSSIEHNSKRDEDEAFFLTEMGAITASIKKLEDRFSTNPLNGTIQFRVQILAETPSSVGVSPECKVFNVWKLGEQQQSNLPERDRTHVRVDRGRAQLTESKPKAYVRSGNSTETMSDEKKPDQPGERQANEAIALTDGGKPNTLSHMQPQTEHVNSGCLDSEEPAQGSAMQALYDSSEEEVPPQPQVGGLLSGSGKQVQNEAVNQQEEDDVFADPGAEQHKERAKQNLPSFPVNMKQSTDLPSNRATHFIISPEESGEQEYSGPRFASNNDAVVPSAPASACFIIPSGVADRCLRLLLQGSGAMKHRKWPSQIMGYAQIRRADMAIVLSKFMDHRRATTRRKASYRTLLPKELYGKDVQVSPVMSLGDPSKEYNAVHLDPINTDQLTGNFRCWTKLSMFVVLCGILMFPSNSDAAEQRIITNHATEGMGPEGCVRASRFCRRMGCSRTKPEETKPDGAESEEAPRSGNNRKRSLPCKLRLKPKREKRDSE